MDWRSGMEKYIGQAIGTKNNSLYQMWQVVTIASDHISVKISGNCAIDFSIVRVMILHLMWLSLVTQGWLIGSLGIPPAVCMAVRRYVVKYALAGEHYLSHLDGFGFSKRC